MSSDYQYDGEGQFFPYFIFTISALITLPLSYSLLKPTDEIENTAPRIHTDFKPQDDELIQSQRRKQRRKERRIKRIITVVVGFAIMALMLYLITVTQISAPKIWDPYGILGISRSSSENEIKKRYRTLSKTLHPDKAVPDVSKNETLDSINDHWVEVSKAFKALTDEEIRNNFIQYGHPDGKQGFSIGIALPQFIINDGNGKFVIGFYALILGVLLPYTVGSWWYSSQKLSKDKVLLATAASLFHEYKEDMTEGDLVNALSCGREFDTMIPADKIETHLTNLEKKLCQAFQAENPSLTGTKGNVELKFQDYERTRRKVAALLWAYLGRLELDSSTLNDEKYESAPTAHALLDSCTAIALAFGNTGPLLATLRTSQHLVQAIKPGSSPLRQLPHMTSRVVSHIHKALPQHRNLSLQQFMAVPEVKRRKICTDAETGLTQTQYETAMAVATQLPFVVVEKAFFKVTGERYITPGSLVQLVIKARVIPPGTTNVPEVKSSDLEDVDPDEDDVNALLGRGKSGKGSDGKRRKEVDPGSDAKTSKQDEKTILPHLAHAPYFPRDHSPRWHIFLADGRMGKVAVPPFTMTTFDRPIFAETEDGGASARRTPHPTFNVQTFKMQFQAPPQAGQYDFVMHLVCDSYIGSDSQQPVTLHVESAEKAEEIRNEDDEISEPEEDSLAGQMSALKSGNLGGQVNGTGKTAERRRKAPVEDISDDESGTDEDVDDDTSATNTDTDEE